MANGIIKKRPFSQPDKTNSAPVGYAYFDNFVRSGRSYKVHMVSPTIKKGNALHMCFRFWFAGFGAYSKASQSLSILSHHTKSVWFGAGDMIRLKIYRQHVKSGKDINRKIVEDNSSAVSC